MEAQEPTVNGGNCRDCCNWIYKRLLLSSDKSIDGDRTDFAFSPVRCCNAIRVYRCTYVMQKLKGPLTLSSLYIYKIYFSGVSIAAAIGVAGYTCSTAGHSWPTFSRGS